MRDYEELPLAMKKAGPDGEASGQYMIPHPAIKGYIYIMVFSNGEGWEHLSITIRKVTSTSGRKTAPVLRCPTWQEMCFCKDLFWDPNECVIQFHPPMSQYVSNSEFCLHIWRPTDVEFPTPPAVLVGLAPELLAKLIAFINDNCALPRMLTDKEYLEVIYMSDPRLVDDKPEEYKKQLTEILQAFSIG